VDPAVITRARARRGAPGAHAAGIVFLLGLAGGAASVALSRGSVDDAFINFRYAQNLADGHGWAYNVGSPFNSATSPLYVLLLGLPAVGGLPPRLGANVVAVLAIATAASCTFVAVRHVRSTLAGALAAVFVVANPWFPMYRGMETALVLALAAVFVMVAFTPGAVRREWLLGGLGGLLLLARMDTVLLVAVVGLALLGTTRRVLWRAAAVAAGIAVAWCALSWTMIGSPLPDTLAAKMAQGRSGFWGPRTSLLTDWLVAVRDNGLWPWLATLVAFAAVGTALGLSAARSRALVAALVAWSVVHVLAYGLILGVPGYRWYYGPVVFCLAALAGLGADGVLTAVFGRRERLVRPTAVAGSAVLIAGVVVGYPNGINYGPYGKAASWIIAHTDPQASVAASEIGYIGYTTNRPMVDFVGLLDTASARDLGRGDTRSWLYRTTPDVFVTHRPIWAIEGQALSAPGFMQSYRLAAGADGLWIFVRQAPLDPATSGPPVVVPQVLRAELDRRQVLGSPADAEALDAVMSVLLTRSDLQLAFFADDEHVNLTALVDWAVPAAASGADSDTPRLAPHRAALVGVAERLRGSGPPVLRFTEALPHTTVAR
jgi:hypothetical protein